MNFENLSKDEETKQEKPLVDFNNLKSNYFIEKVFEMIKKKNKFLEIIRYNKKLQNRFNFNINTYKDYSQLYTPIEIELKPADNLH